MSVLKLKSAEPWAPHPLAAPKTGKRGDNALTIGANGTRTCSGGWHLIYSGAKAGESFRVSTRVTHSGLDEPRDSLLALGCWCSDPPPEPEAFRKNPPVTWNYLLPEIRRAQPAPTPKKVKVCVLTGGIHDRGAQPKGSAEQAFPTDLASATARSAQRWTAMIRSACRTRPDLIVMSECSLNKAVPGHALEKAIRAPGPETDAFGQIARARKTHILLGLYERDGDAVYNTAALIGPNGKIVGKYRKVHLASNESWSGLTPGDEFPVFDTAIGRIGCNICMDSSTTESARMVGLNGADFLLLPIAGDMRADRWSQGSPIFDASRWKALMRSRAIDNQLCMVVARNGARGSCVIDRKGEILAWNDGDEDFITATVDVEGDYRTWNGGDFRDVTWMQRRPHLYEEYLCRGNRGSLTEAAMR